MSRSDGAVELRGVGHVHGVGTPWARRALHPLDLRIEPGERLLVVGGNGSGKSTLAWILAGLIEPSEGAATLDGEPLVRQREHIGLLVQQTRLQLLRPTVGDELAAFDANRGHQLAALLDMGFELGDLTRRIDELSIGQQRRLALAAQLARRSSLLVLDEPMAGLDCDGRAALGAAVGVLPVATTIITVTHDLDESRSLGERIIELDDGRLLADRSLP